MNTFTIWVYVNWEILIEIKVVSEKVLGNFSTGRRAIDLHRFSRNSTKRNRDENFRGNARAHQSRRRSPLANSRVNVPLILQLESDCFNLAVRAGKVFPRIDYECDKLAQHYHSVVMQSIRRSSSLQIDRSLTSGRAHRRRRRRTKVACLLTCLLVHSFVRTLVGALAHTKICI